MKCKNCGQELDEKLRYCKHCGMPVDAGDQDGGEKNPFACLLKYVRKKSLTILAVLGMMAVGAGVGFCLKTAGARIHAGRPAEVPMEEENSKGREAGKEKPPMEGETASETSWASDAGTGTEAESVPESENGAEAESVPESENGAEAESAPEVEPGRETESVPETESASEAELVSEPAAAGEPEAEQVGPVTMGAVVSVTATSSLSEYNMTHTPDRLCDGSLSAAWVEGGAGQGIGESVTFGFDSVYQVSGFVINGGYQKSLDLYQKNSRPAQLAVSLPDGWEEVYDLEDIFGTQNIPLSSPVMTDEITFTIRAVYPGNKYEDTVISELMLY